MEEQKKKFNPYMVVIMILILIIAAFAYNQWGKRFLPSLEKTGESSKPKNIKTEIFRDDIIIGNVDAPVKIIEYYSYLCGYCKIFEDETKPRIMENYITTGKAKFILRPFPPYELGQAVLCAKEQDKFLEYHNYLFDNIENLEKVDDLKTFAKDVGLNESKFNECYNSGKYKSRTEEWYKQGMSDMEKANIPSDQRGTPAFFINGEAIIGAQPYEKFVEAIESKLK
ncbi:MAG: DsbA family protein [Patescibacteria group bacterium]